MGFVKRMMEEAETRMFWPSGDAVCRSHVLDGYLLDQLTDLAAPETCVVCGASRSTQVELDDVCDLVVGVIREYRRRAIDELFHDRETDSGYAFPNQWMEDTQDVVNELFQGAFDDELIEHVAGRLDSEYWFAPGRIWLEGAELYLESWSGFRRLLRATDASMKQLLSGQLDEQTWTHEAADGIRPSEVLPRFLEVIDELGVVRTFDPATAWFRALHTPINEKLTAARLGTAPEAYSAENRMNRSGDPMFYGAAGSATALAEIGPSAPGRDATVGEWHSSRPLQMLDLVAIPEPPDFYDIERAGLRWRYQFLADFAADVSQPVGPHQHVEYRATQVFTEFLRSRVDGLDGIVYRSSLTGDTCCAIDVDNLHCVDSIASDSSADGALRLILENGHIRGDLS